MNKKLIAPILTILVGLAWLLNTLNIIPSVDWVWSIGLAAAGILSIAVGGFNKVSVVTGPFLIVASVFSVLRQTGRISVDHEIPILVIVLGILMLISQLSRLPVPDLFKDENHE
jgi:hypothetical protein|tara:strand:- start:151 stop:492 length:342 start_codon:yes stop_codon:yes gene_type:complete